MFCRFLILLVIANVRLISKNIYIRILIAEKYIHDARLVWILGEIFGGDEEDRTLDLTDANRTLSQLSYRPKSTVPKAEQKNKAI